MEQKEMILINKKESKITLSAAGREIAIYCEPEELRDCSHILSDLFLGGSMIGLDLAKVCALAAAKQKVRVGKGFATGEYRAKEATAKALANAADSLTVLLLLKIPKDALLAEADDACLMAVNLIHPDATLLWGADICDDVCEGFGVQALLF